MWELLEILKGGWRGFKITDISDGRSVWEKNVTLTLDGEFVMYMKVFFGYDYYLPWVELFEIEPRFFSDRRESELYTLIYAKSPELSRLFVEYITDPETDRALRLGVPPELSRLGYELLKAGYRNLRNWYYPEGLKEGGPKLQGGKLPEDVEPKNPGPEIEKFIKSAPIEYPEVKKAVERAEGVLNLFRM